MTASNVPSLSLFRLICSALLAGCAVALLAVMGGSGERQGAAAAAPAPGTLARLPVGLRAAASSAIGAGQSRFRIEHAPRRALVAHGGGLSTSFRAAGPTVEAGGGRLSLRLLGFGRGRTLVPSSAKSPAAAGSRVSYRRGVLSEWYRNGPLGLEQGFTLRHRPAGEGRLTLAIRATGALARRSGSGVVFARPDGRTILSYSGLSALDAAGRSLAARLELAGRTLLLHVADARARYPLTIDPFMQQGGKLTGDVIAGSREFGDSVALSADGNTALVGEAENEGGKGAVWTFARSGSTWHQLGSKLTGSEEISTGLGGRFGWSVALDADGNTALVGGPGDDDEKGAAWAYRRRAVINPGQPAWMRQGDKLKGGGESGRGGFGFSVALARNGARALIGGHRDDGGKGAAWVFTRSGSDWSQQGPKLTPSGQPGPVVKTGRSRGDMAQPAAGDIRFGASVALTGNGDLALIGAPDDNNSKGAAWTFTRSGSTWSQQGGKLTGVGEVGGSQFGNGEFGWSVAVSADGSTALIGGITDIAGKGAAWAYRRRAVISPSQGAWLLLGGAKLTGAGEVGDGEFGESVALSGNGRLALIGADRDDGNKGAAWVFTRTAAGFSQQGGKLTASDQTGTAFFGGFVALAADGNSALIGGPGDAGFKGAAWSFANPPTVASVTPNSGPTGGGTQVTIAGSNFTAASAVRFGGTAATSFDVVSATQISAIAPPGAPGTVDVTVSNSGGPSATSAADQFTYFPGPPVPDTRPPRLTLSGPRREPVRRGSVFVLAKTDEATTATARATVSVVGAAKVYRLKAPRRQLRANVRTRLKLGIPRAAGAAIRGALARHRRLTVKVTVTAKDRSGNATTKRRSIRLRS